MTTSPAPSTSVMVAHPLPRRTNPSYRLLYRGAFSLPDSEVFLEGITFVANLPCKSPGPLMSSPVPLALESMRGRSTLRLVGVVKTADIRLDPSNEVSMYIHRDAFLTRTFFYRVLCQPNLPPSSSSTEQVTEFAVRIGLNDGSGMDDSDLLIYGVPSSPPTASSAGTEQTKMQLRVSRLAPPSLPLSPVKRTPRPDDPAPRPHPLAHLTVSNHSNAHRLGLKRKRSATGNTFSALASACEEAERQRKLGKAPSLTFGGGVSGVGLGINIPGGGRMVDEDGFLIPSPPTRASKKTGMGMGVGTGGAESGAKAKSVTGREKDRGRVSNAPEKMEQEETKGGESEMETNNKTAIKKRALRTLADHGIPKTHDKFRELYSWATRGVGFALRGTIASTKVDRGLIQRLVDTHVGMYMDGLGGNCVTSAAQAKTEKNAESVV